MQNHRLDCVPRSTQYLLILPCLSQSFNNRVDPSAIESILQQLSRFAHANHSDTRHLTTSTGHAKKCSQQSRLVFKLICFTPHLRQSPVALKAGRQSKENQTISRTMKTTTGTRHALLTAFLRMPSGCGQVVCVAMVGVSESTRLLKDQLDC